MLTTKASNVTQKVLTSTDVTQGDYSWTRDGHAGEKLVTGEWTWGTGHPVWTCTKAGVYFIRGMIDGIIGYYQLKLQVNGEVVSSNGCTNHASGGVMVETSTLVHLKAGDDVKLYLHTDTAGIQLNADLWIKNLFVD
ncbi:hypothetical protein [Faecalibaculum rodentium]|uniref:hypothetical protein n=1 Tax=Faecalibaculum rodentium TaxID=1702221 RepID=UPI0025B78D6D|nr:hypothetical protein [Faecalibaculum rodentium]